MKQSGSNITIAVHTEYAGWRIESSPLLELFKTSQGSSLLVRNAFCKALEILPLY